MVTQQIASINPETMPAGGGAPTGNLLVQSARFALWNYNNTQKDTLALKLVLVDDTGATFEQYISAGDPSKCIPSPDGKSAVVISGEGITRGSNFSFFMGELINVGMPPDKLAANDVSVLDNMYAQFDIKAQPTRAGLANVDGRARTVMVPVLIHNLGWEPSKRGTVAQPAPGAGMAPPALAVAAAPAAPAAAPVPPAAVPTGVAVDRNALMLATVQTGIATHQGQPVQRQDVAGHIFSAMGADPSRDQLTQLLFGPTFAPAIAVGGLKLEGETISTA